VIRQLGVRDAATFRTVRLEMLAAHPESFWEKHDDVAARPVASFATLLANAHIFAAEQEGRIIGTCGWYRNAHDLPEITWVYIAPEARGQGIATELMQATLSSIPESHAEVMLQVSKNNAAAVRVYERLGFSPETDRRDLLASGCDMLMVRPLHA